MQKLNYQSPIIRFLAAQTISLFGSSLVQYAIIWYITLHTSSGKMLTIATLCGFLPQICISLFAGVWVDKYSRKRLIMISDSVIAIATLLLAIAFLSGYTNIWLLFTVLIIRSAGTGIQVPAVNALIPELVPQDQLMKIAGINSSLSSLMMFLAPAISGAIFSVASLEITLFIDVITAIVGVGITATVSVSVRKKNLPLGISNLAEIKKGFSYLQAQPFISKLLIFQLTTLFLISPSAFLTPLMVSRTFGADVWRLTASEMTYSLGMVSGGVLIASGGGFKNKVNTTILAGAAYGILMLGLGTAPSFIFYLFCNSLIGITAPCYNAPLTVIIQEKVPQHMHGRIFSFMQLGASCALPLGMVVFGPLADQIPVQQILIATGTLVIVSSLAMLKSTKNQY